MKLVEELGIPVPALNNVRANKYCILSEVEAANQTGRSLKLTNMKN
jgi:hypothetical protein